jgi:hypothetical protein
MNAAAAILSAKGDTPMAAAPFQRQNLSERISFRVTAEEMQLLKAAATRRGVDVVDVIRAALELYFKQSPAETRPRKAVK